MALIAGPGLATGGAEVARWRPRYPDVVMLGQGSATAEPLLGAMDGAWLAHIAAHGTFRADNPLFSSLQLDDGPLTVHDFERLKRAPHWMVLSSCDSGAAAPVGADELLGLVSSLVPLGAVGIVASIVPVNDPAAVPLMLALHEALTGGGTLPEALLAAAGRPAAIRCSRRRRVPSSLSAAEFACPDGRRKKLPASCIRPAGSSSVYLRVAV